MVANTKVTAAFRKLVALVARAFYAGECPPKTAEEAAASMTGRAKLQVKHGQKVSLVHPLEATGCWTILTGYYPWPGYNFAGYSVR